MSRLFRDWNRILREEMGSEGGTGGSAPAATPPAATPPAEGGGSTALSGAPAATGSEGGVPAATPPAVVIPENWKDSLPQEFRDEPSMAAINNVEALVKSYVHSQKMLGRGKMSIPDQNSSDADWAQIYSQLGLPEKFEDYTFDVPKNSNFEDGFLTKLKEVGHKQGILPRQMKGLVEWYSEANNEAIKTHENQMKAETLENMTKLKTEWGQAFDQNLNMAKAAIKASNLGETIDRWLDDTGLGDDPNMIRLLSAMGQMLKEDKLIGEFGEAAAAPKELQSRIDEIQQSDAYKKGEHPNHKKTITELEGLFKQMHPENKPSISQLT